MRRSTIAKALAGGVLLAALLLYLAPELHAQGCAMCYQNAAATGPQGAQALRHAIMVLLVPPVAMFGAIFGLLYQRRNASR